MSFDLLHKVIFPSQGFIISSSRHTESDGSETFEHVKMVTGILLNISLSLPIFLQPLYMPPTSQQCFAVEVSSCGSTCMFFNSVLLGHNEILRTFSLPGGK